MSDSKGGGKGKDAKNVSMPVKGDGSKGKGEKGADVHNEAPAREK